MNLDPVWHVVLGLEREAALAEQPAWLLSFARSSRRCRTPGPVYQARVEASSFDRAQLRLLELLGGGPVVWLVGAKQRPADWDATAVAEAWRLQWGCRHASFGPAPAGVSRLVSRGRGFQRTSDALVAGVLRFEAEVAAPTAGAAWTVIEVWMGSVLRGTTEPVSPTPLPAGVAAVEATPEEPQALPVWRLRCGLWACAEPPAVGGGLTLHARGQGLLREATSGRLQYGVWCFDLDVPAKTEAEAWGVARATLGPGMLQGLGMPLTRSRARRRKGK